MRQCDAPIDQDKLTMRRCAKFYILSAARRCSSAIKGANFSASIHSHAHSIAIVLWSDPISDLYHLDQFSSAAEDRLRV